MKKAVSPAIAGFTPKKTVSTIVLFLVFFLPEYSSGQVNKKPGTTDFASLPVFCAHEHWGSIDAMGGYVHEFRGYYADIYAGATPSEKVSIWDIILDPYFGSIMQNSGIDPNANARSAGYGSLKKWWQEDPGAALEDFKATVSPFMMNAMLHSTFIGIERLYGIKLITFNLKEWQNADSHIALNYSNVFQWYRKAMGIMNFTELIRPVQPEFYLLEESGKGKDEELSFTRTVLRIDPFLALWAPVDKRRDKLSAAAGVDPVDAFTWRAFIRFYADLAEKNHSAGLKSLEAYNRDLDFKLHNDSVVKFRGNLDAGEIKVFQDWVMNEFCRIADERKWVHQVHVGTHNLNNSGPLPLEELGDRYPGMKIVMLHCYPFFNEAAYLARNKPNFYIDNCWVPLLSPSFHSQALDIYLNYVPYNKIMLSNDATSPEMAGGASVFTREILSQKLSEQKERLNLTDDQLRSAALDMLNNNAVRIYGTGKIYK